MIVLHRRGIVDEFKQGMAFQRGSLGWDQRGRLYGLNQARFEVVGARRGVRIEENTVNLLSANQSSAETNLSGFTALNGATITMDTTVAWHGTASIKVDTTTRDEGGSPSIQTTPLTLNGGQPYTFSVYVKGTPGAVIVLTFRSVSKGVIITSPQFTLNGTWQRLSVTHTPAETASDYRLRVTANAQSNPVAPIFFVDGLQLEAKPYPTSWVIGGGTRAAEALTIPTAGIVTPTKGTISLWAYINDVARRFDNGTIFILRNGMGPGPWIWLYHHSYSANWNLQMRDNSGTVRVSITHYPDSNTPDGWHHWAVRYNRDAGTLAGFHNGTKVFDYTGLPIDAFPSAYSNLDIGFRTGDSTDYLNTLFADLHVSNVDRSDAEIAADFTRGYHVPDQYTTFYHPLGGPDSQRAARAVVL